MKKFFNYLTLLLAYFILLNVNSVNADEAYKYRINGTDSSYDIGGTLNIPLNMKIQLKSDNTVRAVIKRNDSYTFNSGSMCLQMDSHEVLSTNRLECTGVGNELLVELHPNKILENYFSKWNNNIMKLYARYEFNDDFVWVGPVQIERIPLPDEGYLSVYIKPDEIVNDAGWHLSGNSDSLWYASGHRLKLPPGEYTVEFKSVTGRAKPSNRNIEVRRGETTQISDTYPSSLCALRVYITPEASGGMYSVWFNSISAWSSFKNSGDIVPIQNGGTTQIKYKTLYGWDEPQIDDVNIVCNEIVDHNAEYCKQDIDSPCYVKATKGIYTDKVVITWDSVVPENSRCSVSYQVWRATENNPDSAIMLASSVNTNEFPDYSGNPSLKYYYWIKAQNENGDSDFCTEEGGYGIGYKKLTVPLNVSATDRLYVTTESENKVHLDWSSVDGADCYEIWRHPETTDLEFALRIASCESNTTFDDKTSIHEREYNYWIIAKNQHVTSDYSSPDIGKKRLLTPENINASDCEFGGFDDKIRITWDPVAGATSYVVYNVPTRRRSSGIVAGTVTGTSKDEISTPGKQEFYKVVAKNDFGVSDESLPDVGTQCLAQPQNVIASDYELIDQIRVVWDQLTVSADYEIWRNEVNDLSSADKVETVTVGNSFDDSPVYKSYYYWVRAKNHYTTSKYSEPMEQGSPDTCNYEFDPESLILSYDSSSHSINLKVQNACFWEVSKNVPWIYNITPQNGYGNATINFNISSITDTDTQEGIIMLMGKNSTQVPFNIKRSASSALQILGNNGKVKVNNKLESLPFMGEFNVNQQVCLEAVPDDIVNWAFDKWSTGVNSNPLCFNITDPTTVTAFFKPIPVNLNIEGNGRVIISNLSDNTSKIYTLPFTGEFSKGSNIKMEPVLDCKNGFDWSDNVSCSGDNCTLALNNDTNISLVCKPLSKILMTLTKSDNSQEIVNFGISSEDINKEAESGRSFVLKDVDYVSTSYSEDFRKEGNTEYYWIIAINPNNEEMTLNWTLSDNTKNYQIRKGTSSMGKVIVSDMKATTQLNISSYEAIQYYTVHMSDNKWPTIISASRGDSNPGVILGIDSQAITKSAAPFPPEYYCSLRNIGVNGAGFGTNISKEGEDFYKFLLEINPRGNIVESSTQATCSINWDPNSFVDGYNYYLIEGNDASMCPIVQDMRTQTEHNVTGDDSKKYLTLIISKDAPREDCGNQCPLFTKGPDLEIPFSSDPQEIQWASGISAGEGETDQNVEFRVTTDNEALFLVNPSITPDGRLSFTPDIDYSGEDMSAKVTVYLEDDGTTPCSSSEPVNFTIAFSDCSTIVSVKPDHIEVGKNTEFSTEIYISNVQNLAAFELHVEYDPAFINAVDTKASSFLGMSGRSTIPVANNINNSSGIIEYAVASLGENNGVDGNGVLFSITWSTLSKSGIGSIKLSSLQLTTPDSSKINSCSKNGVVDSRPSLIITPDNQTGRPGSSFFTDIDIKDINDIGGFEMNVMYDPNYIMPVDIAQGDFLGSSGRSILPIIDVDDAITGDEGKITYALASVGLNSGATGSGTLFTIEWQVLGSVSNPDPLTTYIWTQNSTITNTEAKVIEHKQEKASVVIISCNQYDFDCDCDVDIVDVMSVISKYGKKCNDNDYNANYDLDSDCDVDIVDVMSVISQYGWKCTNDSGTAKKSIKKSMPLIKDFPDVQIGQTFSIDLTIENVESMASFEFKLNYNKDVIEIKDIYLDDFIKSTGRVPIEVSNEIDNENGLLNYAVATMGSTPGAYGDGTLVTIICKLKSEGNHSFNLTNVVITNQNAVPIHVDVLGPFTLSAGSGFSTSLADNHVHIKWETTSEIEDNVSFNVLRSDDIDGPFEKINDEPIPSEGPIAAHYSYDDNDLEIGKRYFYKIEKIDSVSGEPIGIITNKSDEDAISEIYIKESKFFDLDINEDDSIDLKDLLIILKYLTKIN